MGGVDLTDMLIALYRTNLKTHKWYKAIFSQMFDICVNNAWLNYRTNCHTFKYKHIIMNLKEFRMNIAIALSLKNKARVGRKSKENYVPEDKK